MRRLAALVLLSASVAAADSVLVVGDSHSCGPFGKALLREIAGRGDDVTLFCAVSSAPQHWLAGKNPGANKCQTMTSKNPAPRLCAGAGRVPAIASLLAARDWSRVIVALGTNSMLAPSADVSYGNLAQVVGSQRECIWIAPPHMNPAQSRGFPAGRVAQLERNLAPFYTSLVSRVGSHCVLVDSRGATAPGAPGNQTVDGVHRTENAGQAWVAGLMNFE